MVTNIEKALTHRSFDTTSRGTLPLADKYFVCCLPLSVLGDEVCRMNVECNARLESGIT